MKWKKKKLEFYCMKHGITFTLFTFVISSNPVLWKKALVECDSMKSMYLGYVFQICTCNILLLLFFIAYLSTILPLLIYFQKTTTKKLLIAKSL